ncbi:MAG: hypothetical protein JOY64_33745 [Alphaproteobacteria bacterium]|nr:hypothetical protein [Alphaproteobacteria bacterium]MBV8412629.1 hypothetical protein [Alphaproteobacteria bacterium]
MKFLPVAAIACLIALSACSVKEERTVQQPAPAAVVATPAPSSTVYTTAPPATATTVYTR